MKPNLISDTSLTIIDNNMSVLKDNINIDTIDITYEYFMIYNLFENYVPKTRIMLTKIILEDMILEYCFNPTMEVSPYIESLVAIVEYDLDVNGTIQLEYTNDIIDSMTEHANYIERLYERIYGMLTHIDSTDAKVLPCYWNIVNQPGDDKFKAHLSLFHHKHIMLDAL